MMSSMLYLCCSIVKKKISNKYFGSLADIHTSRCEIVMNMFACKKWWKELNLFYSILFYVVGPGDGEDSRSQEGRQDWRGGGQA
jgi:hypothetical protein